MIDLPHLHRPNCLKYLLPFTNSYMKDSISLEIDAFQKFVGDLMSISAFFCKKNTDFVTHSCFVNDHYKVYARFHTHFSVGGNFRPHLGLTLIATHLAISCAPMTYDGKHEIMNLVLVLLILLIH